MDSDLTGKRALVMGIGTRQGGLGVTRYLLDAGADVTVTDLRDVDSLTDTLRQLDGLPVRFVLGEHRREDFERADLVVRNPGVPHDSPWLQIARDAGASIEMEMTLFFRACPAPIIGITGTKGKTTTSTLCAAILENLRDDTVLAGNMGRSSLARLPQITPETPVVIELSSWQLEGLGEHRLSPQIAVFTNLSPDHLNRYASMDDYLDAKLNIARYQQPNDWFVVNKDDATVWGA
ncbi:MAG TPA: Mur ligase family protein, partial [Nitrolancea sp.]